MRKSRVGATFVSKRETDIGGIIIPKGFEFTVIAEDELFGSNFFITTDGGIIKEENAYRNFEIKKEHAGIGSFEGEAMGLGSGSKTGWE